MIENNLRPRILKNQLFFKAVDYLIENKYVETQKELSIKIGVSETTLSNLKNDKKIVSDKTIYKLMDAFPGIFNMAYFRGENIYMLLEDAMQVKIDSERNKPQSESIDQSSLVNAVIAAKDQLIEELKEKYEKMEQEKDARIAELKQLAEERLHRIAELRRVIESHGISLTDSIFPVGVAERQNQKHI